MRLIKNYIVFGTGIMFARYISRIKESVNVAACIDNNEKKHWTKIDDIPVYPPSELEKLSYEKIVLLVNPLNAIEIKKQLCELGIDENKIQFYEQFFAEISGSHYEVYEPEGYVRPATDYKICIISTALNYNGGTIAVCNLAKVLVDVGHDVTLVSYETNLDLLKELNEHGIKVIIYPAILSLTDDTLIFFKDYDKIIINTLQMMDCVLKCSAFKKVVWWLHEPSDKYSSIYRNTLALHPEYRNCDFNNISVFAVSSIAKRNFHYYYPNVECGILSYSLPDYIDFENCNIKIGNKLIFALIACFSPLKAQKEFIIAASEIEKKYHNVAEFWLIGNVGNSSYSQEIIEIAEQIADIKILGLKTQAEIQKLYNELDVIVCPSYEDCLPIVITEGFMNSKVCIASNNTGAAQFIMHQVNGLICEPGNIDSIESCMDWCLSNRDKLSQIGTAARKIYEENFSMEIMRRNIMKICKFTGGGV